MNAKMAELALSVQNRLSEIENTNLRERFACSLTKLQNNLSNIAQQLNQQLKNFENSSENIVNVISKKIKRIENSLQKLYSELEHQKVSSL